MISIAEVLVRAAADAGHPLYLLEGCILYVPEPLAGDPVGRAINRHRDEVCAWMRRMAADQHDGVVRLQESQPAGNA